MAPASKKSPSTVRRNGGNAASRRGSKSLWEEHKNIIIGAAAGAGLLLAIIIFCICRCVCKKKKKRRQQNKYQAQGGGDPRYYNPQSPPHWGNGGGGGWNQSSPMPPPNGGGGGWGQSSQMMPPPNGGGGGSGWGHSSQMMPPPNGSGGGWGNGGGMTPPNGGGGGWSSSSPMPPPPNGSGGGMPPPPNGGGGGWSSSSPMPPPPNGGGGGYGWGSSSPMRPPNGNGSGSGSGSGWGSSPGMPPTSGGGPIYNGEESQNFSGLYQQLLPPPPPGIPIGFNKNSFTYEELSIATGGFSRANMIGQGGFGYVHKGVLSNGKEVAIKSLKSGSGQGEREFQAEVDIISRVHHRHLVSLVGYCVAGEQRMLVYDFVPNNTLEYHLHGKNVPVMDFPSRLRIALGAAKGLAYLHEDCHPKIIHRDIKAANILLDNNFEAMVADFGLARLSSDNHTHVSTRVMGTFGYLAPEYASSGKLTDKSDVFSYGIMMLELITGKQPVDTTLDDTLVDWARPLLTSALEKGNIEELVDPLLEGNYDRDVMLRMIACASACVRHAARKRPKMSQIVRALEGNVSLDDLTDRVKPTDSSLQPSGASSDSLNAYGVDEKKFKQSTTSSQELSSGEYGVSSTEHSREIRPGEMQKQGLV